MQQVTATATIVKNVKDEDMYYLILKAGEKKVYVSIGKKTHDGVKALEEGLNKQEEPPKPPTKLAAKGL